MSEHVTVGRSQPTHAFQLTDVGNGSRLVAAHGTDLRYCHPWRKWLSWDGRRWREDDSGEVMRRAKATVGLMYAEASQLEGSQDRMAIAQHARRSESRYRIKAMIELAQSEDGISALPSELDSDPWLLNVRNGTIDLRAGQLREHRREDLITKHSPVVYDPTAQCPTWEQFLHEIMDGDSDRVAFMRKAVGYSLTGDTREQTLFVLHGRGANGKSTFVETVHTLLGDYAKRTPTETLMVKRNGTIPNDVARLKGTRLVTATEGDVGQRLAESLVKQLTGQDTISARFMRGEWFDFKPQFKIWFATNHRPALRGTDHAIRRRIRLVPFDVTIADDHQDKELPAKLRAELPGIMAWAVRGCIEWQQEGLGTPSAVRQATDEYLDESDPLRPFIDECVTLGRPKNDRVRASEIEQAYHNWCSRNDEAPMNRTRLGRSLRERGFRKRKNGGVVWYLGLRLHSPDHVDEGTV